MTHHNVTALLGTLASSVQISGTSPDLTLTCEGVSVTATLAENTLSSSDGVIAFTGVVSGDARVNILHPLFTELRGTLKVPLNIQRRTADRMKVDGHWRPTLPGLNNHHSLAVLTSAPTGVDAGSVWTDPTDLSAAHVLDLLSALREPTPSNTKGAYL